MSKQEASEGVRASRLPDIGRLRFRRDTGKPASSYARNYGNQIGARKMARGCNAGN